MTQHVAGPYPAPSPRLPVVARVAGGSMLFAALGQLCFLAHWPMFVAGHPLGDWGTLAVALTRTGIYAALGLGLLQGDPRAYAGTVLEWGRSFLLFLIPIWGHDRQLLGALFPASWAQGALSGWVPVLVLVNGAMAAGWSPGNRTDLVAAIAVRLAAGACALLALSLRSRYADRAARSLWWDGAPVVLVLSGVEGLALWIGR